MWKRMVIANEIGRTKRTRRTQINTVLLIKMIIVKGTYNISVVIIVAEEGVTQQATVILTITVNPYYGNRAI